jgi:hypothetical protein
MSKILSKNEEVLILRQDVSIGINRFCLFFVLRYLPILFRLEGIYGR